ncbi:hypothetical protein SKAU_G00415810 [Synaphobranchus kaupii]|uniref:Uncharacterized protein n=1 Tax=Synaphobranchus kaupii TaxID=118154 RepID=A0A9Q1E7A6_SYNKA|nr:hypothetical protein SKAU_G00415810 [Synaphobranchus kaupii]
MEEKGKTLREFLARKRIGEVTAKPLKILRGLLEYFKEEPKELLLNKEDVPAELPSTPCIIDVDKYSYVFSLFYVLNVKYPKGAALTLEFIQRGLLGINPERGSKAEKKGKKQHNIPPKLLRFLSHLSDFENA